MPEGLDKLASGVGKAIKTVPDLYDDALKPATQESGKTLALIPRAINAALVPLRQWIAEREYKLAETEKLLAKKLEHVGEEKIVTPEAYVAVPAIQAISYSMNSEELRNLYANLLAKAMNSDTKDQVHPSFVEIIKQMSPTDAIIFKSIMKRKANPLIDLIKESPEKSSFIIATNVSEFNDLYTDKACMSIDNLNKFGLISILSDRYYSDANFYNKILHSKYYVTQKQNHSVLPNDYQFSHKKKMIIKTSLGITFYNTCVIDLDEPTFLLNFDF